MNKRNSTKILLAGSILLLAINSSGQNKDSLYIPNQGIKLAYLGSLIYPGLRLGTELPLRLKYIVRSKRNKSKLMVASRSATVNIGYYHQKAFHDNIYLTTEWQMRRQHTNGWFTEFSPGVGLSKTFIAGTTYRVSSDGNVTIEKLAGYTYGMVTLAGGLGYDFLKRKRVPLKGYTKLTIINLYPFNSFIYPRPTLELGVIYSYKSFLKINPSVKIKRK